MPIDVAALRAAHPIAEVVARYVRLSPHGREFKGLCPFHNEKSPSFTLYGQPRPDRFKCFGCGAEGDVVEFVSRIENVRFREACERIAGNTMPPMLNGHDHQPAPVHVVAMEPALTVAEPALEHEVPIVGQPVSAYNVKRAKWTTIRPVMVHVYRDSVGEILGVICRVIVRGEKVFMTLRRAQCPADPKHEPGPAWAVWSFDTPRPLYGLDLLAPDGDVLVVEGEKAAEAARRMLPGWNVITWPGGAAGVAHADWTPLAGRTLLLWGDADEPGEKAMRDVAECSQATVRGFIPWDTTLEKGYDAADLEREGGGAEEWIASREQRWKPAGLGRDDGVGEPPARDDVFAGGRDHAGWPDDGPSGEMAVRSADRETDEILAHIDPGGDRTDPIQEPTREAPFRALGHNHGTYYYLPAGSQQIMELSRAEHTLNNLIGLAPLAYWENSFPGKSAASKFDVANATDWLIRTGEACGIFETDRLRGRGAWAEGNEAVVNLGHLVITGDYRCKPSAVNGRYIYEAASPLDLAMSRPARPPEAIKLVEICNKLTWETPLAGSLLAGWCVVSAVCGALRWRPHIWVTGPAHSGKSTVMREIIGRMLGKIGLYFEGNTTEAAIRQTLGRDARPVRIDEAEAENKWSANEMKKLLFFARVSSDGGTISKGTTSGEAVSYVARSSFCFTSINTSLSEYADETRFSKLVLRKFPGSKAAGDAHFKALTQEIVETLTEQYAAAMFARSIANMETLLFNCRTFVDACAVILQNRRAADQIGTMLAGLHLCFSDKRVTATRAMEWIKEREWQEFTPAENANDGAKLVSTIMLTRRKITTNRGVRELTIGELIDICDYGATEEDVSPTDAKKELGRIGIKVMRGTDVKPAIPDLDGGDETYFIVANKSSELSRVLNGTPWSSDWSGPLKQLAGAVVSGGEFFSTGLIQRGIALPVRLIRGAG